MGFKIALALGLVTFCALGCGEEPTVEEFYCPPDYDDPICQENPDGGVDAGN